MVCGFLDRVQAFYNKLDKMDKELSLIHISEPTRPST